MRWNFFYAVGCRSWYEAMNRPHFSASLALLLFKMSRRPPEYRAEWLLLSTQCVFSQISYHFLPSLYNFFLTALPSLKFFIQNQFLSTNFPCLILWLAIVISVYNFYLHLLFSTQTNCSSFYCLISILNY